MGRSFNGSIWVKPDNLIRKLSEKCSEHKPLPYGLCSTALWQVSAQYEPPACTHLLPNPLACLLPLVLVITEHTVVYLFRLVILFLPLWSINSIGAASFEYFDHNQGSSYMFSKYCWRNDCCLTSIRTVWPGSHACAFLCTFCLPLSLSQVSAIWWPGGWLNRFLCLGLGFFFSLSLFFYPPYHLPSTVFSLSFGASFSVSVSLSFSVSSAPSSLSLSLPRFLPLSLSPSLLPPRPQNLYAKPWSGMRKIWMTI